MKQFTSFKSKLTKVVKIEAGDLDKAGYASISNTGTLGTFGSAVVPAIVSSTYDIDITVDGTIRKLAVALLNTDSWSSVATKIQSALRTATSKLETVSIVSGKIVVTSTTLGSTSSVLIAAGTTGSLGGDLLAYIDSIGATYVTHLDTPVAGTEGTISFAVDSNANKDLGTAGYSYIYSDVTPFVGTAVPALNATYQLQVGVDGGVLNNLSIVITSAQSWNTIAATIQTALRSATSGTEVVSISNGRILITSGTVGTSSKIVIKEGLANGLLAIIATLTDYNPNVGPVVSGRSGSTQDYVATSIVGQTSAGLYYTGLIGSYNKTTGVYTISDNLAVTNMAAGDFIYVNLLGCYLNELA